MNKTEKICLTTDIKNFKSEKEFDDFILNVLREMELYLDSIVIREERECSGNVLIGRETTYNGFSQVQHFYEYDENNNMIEILADSSVELTWNKAIETVQAIENSIYYPLYYQIKVEVKQVIGGHPAIVNKAKYEVTISCAEEEDIQKVHAQHRFKNKLLDYFDREIWEVKEIS